MSAALPMLEVVDQVGQERHANPQLYEMVVGALGALADPRIRRWWPRRSSSRCSPSRDRHRCSTRASRAARTTRHSSWRSTCSRAACSAAPAGGGGPQPRGALATAAHARGWVGRGARRAPLGRHRRDRRPGHRSDRGASRPPAAVGPHRSGDLSLAEPEEQPPFGVYVHVPFCRHRCDYCAFATYTDRDHLMEVYDVVVRDRARPRRRAGGDAAGHLGLLRRRHAVATAGRPPGLDPRRDPRRPGAEVTVECNPEDVEPRRLAVYRAGGVTRVSLGVQSTVPHVLAGLGRRARDPGDRRGGRGGGRRPGSRRGTSTSSSAAPASGTRTGSAASATCSARTIRRPT